MRQILPHMLRTLGKNFSSTAKSFWFGCAEGSYERFVRAGEKSQALCENAGSFFQWMFNRAFTKIGFYAGHVDPQRIENFKLLYRKQKEHLFDVVLSSKKIAKEERDRFIVLRARFPQNITVKQEEELILTTLRVYDRLSPQELLAISPTYFNSLEARTKQRIVEVVDKYTGLTREERTDTRRMVNAIVGKFNRLSDSQKQEIDQVTARREFRQLHEDAQEDILFVLTQSKAFQKFAHEERQKKMQRGEVGFLDALTGVVDTEISSAAHKFDQFKRASKMSNEKLKDLLPFLGQVSDDERAILTPSRLKYMSNKKILHCFEIVKKYNFAGISQFSKESTSQLDLHDLEEALKSNTMGALRQKMELLSVLATLFNDLPGHERAEFLNFTEGEFGECNAEQKQQLLTFLASQTGISKEIKDQLVKLQKNERLFGGGSPATPYCFSDRYVPHKLFF